MVQSVNRTLDILESLSQKKSGSGVTELSVLLGLSKSTVHRLLNVLSSRGYVIKTLDTGKYSLSYKAFELAHKMDSHQCLIRAAAPFMERILGRFGETVNLAVLDENMVLFSACCESSFPVGVRSIAGHRGYVHSTALGKVILAYLAKDEVKQLLKSIELKRFTPKTITSAAKLKKELIKIRKDGYAIDDEEGSIGCRCVAVPITDSNGKAMAAISVSGPSSRLTLDNIETVVEFMKGMTGEIADEVAR